MVLSGLSFEFNGHVGVAAVSLAGEKVYILSHLLHSRFSSANMNEELL